MDFELICSAATAVLGALGTIEVVRNMRKVHDEDAIDLDDLPPIEEFTLQEEERNA